MADQEVDVAFLIPWIADVRQSIGWAAERKLRHRIAAQLEVISELQLTPNGDF